MHFPSLGIWLWQVKHTGNFTGLGFEDRKSRCSGVAFLGFKPLVFHSNIRSCLVALGPFRALLLWNCLVSYLETVVDNLGLLTPSKHVQFSNARVNVLKIL